MPASPADDPILKSFRAALDTIYGDRIERAVLCGSRRAATHGRTPTTMWVPLVTEILYKDARLSTPCPPGGLL
jgi:hypothetical protein